MHAVQTPKNKSVGVIRRPPASSKTRFVTYRLIFVAKLGAFEGLPGRAILRIRAQSGAK